MLFSKFDLYKPEWLEVVFDGKNKNYGAYDLRRHYGDTMAKAMGVTFMACLIGVVAINVVFRHDVVPVERPPVIFELTEMPPPIIPKKETEQPKPQPSSPAKKMPTDQLVAMKPVEGATNEPLKVDEIKNPIGPETVKGDNIEAVTNLDDTGKGTGQGPGTGPGIETVDDGVHSTGELLEVMPEPYGGAEAWSKFLQKNIRYPGMAVDQGVQGKVFVSFIIEKDGHLSNITIERGPGFGLNEEALRVLKKAPAWKPGVQNGQKVRVKYTIPINFQLSDQ
jgi:protein TonB